MIITEAAVQSVALRHMVAALFVAKDGPYFGLEDVDPWDAERDARAYAGPHPVVANPPCERYGRYWSGGPSAKTRRLLGDDGGCFDRALWCVRRYGGVLEHPAGSSAFRYYRLNNPIPAGGWSSASDGYGGQVCQVSQGHYGHLAQKNTWLYAVGCDRPEFTWGPCEGKVRIEDGFHSSEERAIARAAGIRPVERLSYAQRIHTPIPFRDILLSLAREVANP